MGKIKKILENELVGGTQNTDVYPVTSVKAVYDESNERLDNILNRRGVVNISTSYNADHIAEVLTLEQAIAKVPSKDRVLGFQGKFLSGNGWKSYIFIGDSIADWTNKTKWNNYLTGTDIVQESGEADDKVMSQKAVNDEIQKLKGLVLLDGASHYDRSVLANFKYFNLYNKDLGEIRIGTVYNSPSEKIIKRIILRTATTEWYFDNVDEVNTENFSFAYDWSKHSNNINAEFSQAHIAVGKNPSSVIPKKVYDNYDEIQKLKGLVLLDGASHYDRSVLANFKYFNLYNKDLGEIRIGTVYNSPSEKIIKRIILRTATTEWYFDNVDEVNTENFSFAYDWSKHSNNINAEFSQAHIAVGKNPSSVIPKKVYKFSKKTLAIIGDSIMALMSNTNISGNVKSYIGTDGKSYERSQLTLIGSLFYVTSSLVSGKVTENSILVDRHNSKQAEFDVQNWNKLKEILACEDIINCGIAGARIPETTISTSNPTWDDVDTCCISNGAKWLKRLVDGGRKSPDMIVIWAGTNSLDSDMSNYDEIMAVDWETLNNNIEGAKYRKTFFGGIRYTLEYLYRNFPNTHIMILSPIQAAESMGGRTYVKSNKACEALKKMSDRYACLWADALHEIGIVNFYEPHKYLYDGVHPNYDGKVLFANYLANKIESLYF